MMFDDLTHVPDVWNAEYPRRHRAREHENIVRVNDIRLDPLEKRDQPEDGNDR